MIDYELIISDALATLVPLVITILGVLLVNYLKSRGVKNDIVTQVEAAYALLADCVNFTNQTFVDALKKEGKFDKEAQAAAFELTKQRFAQLCTDAMALAIETTYNSLSSWLQVTIESSIYNNNVNNARIAEGNE